MACHGDGVDGENQVEKAGRLPAVQGISTQSETEGKTRKRAALWRGESFQKTEKVTVRAAIAALLLALFGATPAWAALATQSVHDENTKLDTACHPARLLGGALPAIAQDTGTTYDLDLTAYGTAGDSAVSASADCGDLAGSIAITVTGGPTNLVIDLTNPKIPRLKTGVGGFTVAGSGTGTVHWDNAEGVEVTKSFAWAITAPGGSLTAITQTCAKSRFVRTSGNNALDGCTHATAWRDINQVNSATIPLSTDVWILAGESHSSALLVDWEGTAADNVVVGGYRMQGTTPVVNEPSNFTVWRRPADYTYAVARPIIRGTYATACRVTSAAGGAKCPLGSPFNTGAAVPSSIYAGLIQTTRRHITIQDLDIQDSSGEGIRIGGGATGVCRYTSAGSGGNPSCQTYVTIQRNRIYQSASSGITAGYTAHNVIRWNEVGQDSVGLGDLNPTGPQANASFRGPSISVANCAPCNTLVEGNDAWWGWNEGSGLYGAAYVLLRGHRSVGHARATHNSGTGHDMVYEQNLGVGSIIVDPYADRSLASAYWLNGWEQSAEATPSTKDGIEGLRPFWRNSMVTGPGTCWAASFASVHAANYPGSKSNGYRFGNTCVSWNTTSYGFNFASLQDSSNWIEHEQVNNMIVGSLTCSSPNNALLQFHHNYWAQGQPIAACRNPGTGDVYTSDTGLAPFNWAASQWGGTLPDASDFRPAATGDGATAGVAQLTQTAIDSSTTNNPEGWTWILSQRAWLPGPECGADQPVAQIPEADWYLDLKYDYCQKERTVHTIGAMTRAP